MKKLLFAAIFFVTIRCAAQPVDFTKCRSCTTDDIKEVKEINTKYLGVKGRNPSVPSTYSCNKAGGNSFL